MHFVACRRQRLRLLEIDGEKNRKDAREVPEVERTGGVIPRVRVFRRRNAGLRRGLERRVPGSCSQSDRRLGGDVLQDFEEFAHAGFAVDQGGS